MHCRPASLLLTLGAAAFLPLALSRADELPTAVPESVGMSSAKLAEVDHIVGDLIAQKKLAGATVAIASQGKVVYFKAFGEADIESHQPMKEDTLFRIYSMSKAISTVAALMLYEEGKISLDDPVSKYIPSFRDLKVDTGSGPRPPLREATIRDLMRHTAGFSYGAGDTPAAKKFRDEHVLDRNEDLQAMAAKLSHVPLKYDPGTRWLYSAAVDVLGRVVEVASGQTFDAFLQKRIFTPLDLNDTGFAVAEGQGARLASVYHPDGKGGLAVSDAGAKSPFLKKPALFSGGGGLVSSTRDYMRFLVMIQNGGELDGKRYLKPETVALMTHNQLPQEVMPIALGTQKRFGVGFGLGFSVRVEASPQWDADAPVGEYGWGGAASSHYWVSPKHDLVVVTMEQTMPYSFLLEWKLKGPIYQAIHGHVRD